MSDKWMTRREVLRITAVSGLSAAFGAGIVSAVLRDARLHRVRRTRSRMGTLVTLTVVHPDAAAAEAMTEAAFQEMERLESILSRHRPDAALGRLNAQGRLDQPPSELVAVLREALALARASQGAFDPTVLPLLELYQRSFASAQGPPSPDEVAAALTRVDYRQVHLSAAEVVLDGPGVGVTLDGIAKGFVVDRTVETLVRLGAERVLVDAGGDMATAGEGAAGEPWTVAIQDPHRREGRAASLRLAGEGLATSGDYLNRFSPDGRHHHILDPRTGRSPEQASSVSVVAPTAMQADGLSTAVMVMGPEQGLELLEKTGGVEGLVLAKNGERRETSGFFASAGRRALTVLTCLSLSMAGAREASAQATPLFASHDPLAVTLTADFTALRGDRDESPDRPGTLIVADEDGRTREIPVEVRTRGAFRLDPSNCSFPPLRLDVDGDAAFGTPFEGQDDLKLVSSCRPGRASYEELVVKEYLAYRSVGVVTDASFRVRLLEATFVDTGGDREDTRVAFLVEEDEALARRLGAVVFDLEEGRNLPAQAFDPVSRMTNAIAQYMLANPDWSDVAGHNVEILDRGGVALAIPYDFDFSGVVDAPYATAPPEYQLASVRERYYRGWCENPVVTSQVMDRFRAAREGILQLWRSEEMLSAETRARSVSFLEDFFEAIEDVERAQRRFLRDCRPLER
ncbi:MAG: FAD:protein FMN transferase [Longimicrobiales bacterium]|nr:FAD:protein FMN transferase [Longimicrobiales bacterium]